MSVTNEQVMKRLADLEHEMQALKKGQEGLARRQDKLDGQWEWLTDTLGRLLAASGTLSERVVVLTLRVEKRLDEIEERIAALACARPRQG